jgi:hypothetical protein
MRRDVIHSSDRAGWRAIWPVLRAAVRSWPHLGSESKSLCFGVLSGSVLSLAALARDAYFGHVRSSCQIFGLPTIFDGW